MGDKVTDSARAAIDLAHLKQYTGGDMRLETEILSMFVPNARGYVEQMIGAESAEAWQHAAHALKGVARGVGAFGLADVAEILESRYTMEKAERDALLTDLQSQLNAVEDFVAAHLGN
jgi:HPt (histidine-containing phosphotransfer) domain-containing protein